MSVKEKLHTWIDRLDDAQAQEVLDLVAYPGKDGADAGAFVSDTSRSELPTIPARVFQAQIPKDLRALAIAQGIGPITNFDDLLGDFWPEDETADQFVAAVREWRRDGGHA